MRTLLAFLLIVYSFKPLSGQTKERDSILNVLEEYALQHDSKSLIRISKEAQKTITAITVSDSVYLANLLYYEFRGASYSGNKMILQKLYTKTLNFCPNNEEGRYLQGMIIKASTIIESINGLDIKLYNKTQKALSILEGLKEPPQSTLYLLYLDLARYSLDFGKIERHKNYLNSARKIINQEDNKTDTSMHLNFYCNNLDFSISSKTEENEIIFYMNKIENLQNKESNALYDYRWAAAKVSVARYYLEQLKHGDKKAAQKAYQTINSLIAHNKNDNAMLYYKKFAWTIKNEVLLVENKLAEALKSDLELIDYLKPIDSRRGYTLDFHIRLLLKLNRIEDAQKEIYTMLNSFHIGSEKLESNFSNFETKEKLEFIYIFLTLSDAFKVFEKHSVETRKTIITLNKLALIQFQNTIKNKLTTPKTRVFLDRIISNFLATRHYKLGYGMTTPELLESIENLENTLDWQEFLQNRSYAQLPFIDDFKYKEVALRDQLVSARKKKQDSTIIKLEFQLDHLKKDFKERHPNYSKLAFSDYNIVDFQNKMQKNEVVLRYKKVKDSLYAFVISKNDVELLNIGHSPTISTSIKTYVSDITERINSDQLSKKLYDQIIPKEALVFNQINIVPDAYLFKLPFETLKNSAGNYLIEDKAILYAPYLSLLQDNASSKTSNNQKSNANLMIFTPSYEGVAEKTADVLVRGNAYRLNGAEKESKLLANVFDNASFSNYSATKENFKEHAPTAQLLHLSMHADIDPVTPELSYLLFTEGNADNKLYIEELYGMNLKANMAVLSACNTGNVLNADNGIVSLHRAFTQAGVPTTVASLWSAPDNATQEIMVEFYKELKAGKTKAKALQLAKLHYLKTTDDALLKAPFYWAGFVINGNNSAVITPKSNITYIVWFLIAFVIVLWIVFNKNRFRSLKNNF